VRCLGFLLSVLFLFSTSAIAQVSQNLRERPSVDRTFFMPDTQQRSKRKDAFHFDADAQKLVVCSNSRASACQEWNVTAKDILPLVIDGEVPSLLISTKENGLERCGVTGETPNAKLNCKPIGIDELAGAKPLHLDKGIQFFKFGVGDDRFDCSFAADRGLICSSARAFQRGQKALLFGNFANSKSSMQVIDLHEKQARVCTVGGKCTGVQGLELLSNNQFIAAGKFSTQIDGHMLIGTRDGMQVTCAPSGYTSRALGFHCESEVTKAVGGIVEPFVVLASMSAKLDGAVYVKRNNQTGGPLQRQLTDWEFAALQENSSNVNRLAARAALNSGAAATTRKLPTGPTVSLSKAGLPDPGDLPSDLFGPNHFEVWLEDEYRSVWSDALEQYYRDWRQGPLPPRTECIAACDAEFNFRMDGCMILGGIAAGARIAVPALVVVIVAISGPGGPAAAATIARVTLNADAFTSAATIGAGVTGACGGYAAVGRRSYCYNRCGF
jgi:hypothetical protein